MTVWRTTHRSKLDGSEARMTGRAGWMIALENENGDTFEDHAEDWEPIDEVAE